MLTPFPRVFDDAIQCKGLDSARPAKSPSTLKGRSARRAGQPKTKPAIALQSLAFVTRQRSCFKDSGRTPNSIRTHCAIKHYSRCGSVTRLWWQWCCVFFLPKQVVYRVFKTIILNSMTAFYSPHHHPRIYSRHASSELPMPCGVCYFSNSRCRLFL